MTVRAWFMTTLWLDMVPVADPATHRAAIDGERHIRAYSKITLL